MLKDIMKYSGFVENSIKQKYAYKVKALLFSISSLIFMLIQYYLWKAIFNSNNGTLYDISLKQYISYIGIGLIVENLTQCPQDLNVGEEVKSGSIAMNLLKPFSYRRMVFARHVGEKTGELVSLIPVFLVIILGTGVNIVSGLTLLQFAASLAMAFVIAFLICYLTGIMAFWSTNCWGLHYLRKSLTFLFSGQVIAINILFRIASSDMHSSPIPFISMGFIKSFFRVLGNISYLLPFQSAYYTPTGIYTNLIAGQAEIRQHLLLQAFWLVLLLLLTQLVWKKAQDKITILGG